MTTTRSHTKRAGCAKHARSRSPKRLNSARRRERRKAIKAAIFLWRTTSMLKRLRSSRKARSKGSGRRPVRSFRAASVGSAAFGALALGAGAIAALAIRRLAIGRAVVGRLDIRELKVAHLEVEELVVHRDLRTPAGE